MKKRERKKGNYTKVENSYILIVFMKKVVLLKLYSHHVLFSITFCSGRQDDDHVYTDLARTTPWG